jgi:hypothetical protein
MKESAAPEPAEERVSEDEIVQACIRGDMTQLRRWARRGIRVSSGQPLVQTAAHSKIDVMRYLVSDLAANVHQTDDQGFTPLFSAAQFGHLAVMRCLVKELTADVNQATHEDFTPLHIAAYIGHLAVV